MNEEVVIKVENISKLYRLGTVGNLADFREKITNMFSRKKPDLPIDPDAVPKELWALKDVSFEVKQSEVLGIIGRNGAGKSTMLKVLSQITDPTEGRIGIKGRIASLLEVGTGFHPELTGRENVFLNGSILGMSRAEVKRKFDEIVAFSEVGKFIDTPVKRYSSGMYVRLAFSVAAHLDPEIMIIDEVLSVGDSSFQRKCVRKMNKIAEEGRTVIFVSHVMHSVKMLCDRAILMSHGTIEYEGDVNTAISKYLGELPSFEQHVDLTDAKRLRGEGNLQFKRVAFDKPAYYPSDSFEFEIELAQVKGTHKDLELAISIENEYGDSVYHICNTFLENGEMEITHRDSNKYYFRIPRLGMRPGLYNVMLFARSNDEIQDWITGYVSLEIQQGNIYGYIGRMKIKSVSQPEFSFRIEE